MCGGYEWCESVWCELCVWDMSGVWCELCVGDMRCVRGVCGVSCGGGMV